MWTAKLYLEKAGNEENNKKELQQKIEELRSYMMRNKGKCDVWEKPGKRRARIEKWKVKERKWWVTWWEIKDNVILPMCEEASTRERSHTFKTEAVSAVDSQQCNGMLNSHYAQELIKSGDAKSRGTPIFCNLL